ncbi:MAG: hypothetical protein PWQ82_816 [Thermosediminibacterales bacterium]|nr:hypothetical protein [Thermosediminibacterales bacterium]MDK2835765.1 hypothetical protein [Thermosediminibacterales bacterium]
MRYEKMSFFLIVMIAAFSFSNYTVAAATPIITGQAAVLIDADNGQILYEKNSDKRMFPASTTKIMTAILALENGKLTDKIKAGPEIYETYGTRLYLEEGEELTLEQLLYGLLLRSANDAAAVIAKYIGGSIENFARMMNEKAKEIGCTNTNFVNPHGLHDENHYTTAKDLAIIAKYAMKIPEFRKIVATKSKVIPWPGKEYDRQLYNGNKLLEQYEGADGVKTGYTSQAQQTLVASATRDGHRLIAVVLKSQGKNIWSDAKALLDYGFSNFVFMDIIDSKETVTTIDVKYGGRLPLVTEKDFKYTMPKDIHGNIEEKIVIKNDVVAPIKKGQVMGEIQYTINGQVIGRVNLLAKKSIARKIYTYWWFWPFIIFTPLICLFVILSIYNKQKRLRYKNRYQYISLQRWYYNNRWK